MPVYAFVCDECQKTEETYVPITEDVLPPDCPKCYGTMRRDYHAERAGNHTEKEFYRPIQMYSIAMQDPDEIKAFIQACPSVEVSLDPQNELYGVPLAANRAQKLAALKQANFVEV